MATKKKTSKSKRSSLNGRNNPTFISAEETAQDQRNDSEPPVRLDSLGRPLQIEHIQQYKFKPGQTGNPLGRPPDPVKEIGKRIAAARMDKVLKAEERELATQLGFNAADMTLLEHLMVGLATSRNPMKIELFLKRTFGNVPNININAEVSAQLVSRFKSKFTDSELEAIGDGASAMDILFDKLPDVDQDDEDTIDGEISE
jgi:hypothetical protein